jgi:hypothetical protein
MTIRSQLQEMKGCGAKKPAAKTQMKEAFTKGVADRANAQWSELEDATKYHKATERNYDNAPPHLKPAMLKELKKAHARREAAISAYHGPRRTNESCTTTPGDKSVVWHEGIRYQFRNGMWATPRGYVWPNTDLCRALDQAHEDQEAAGRSYSQEDQQGVGLPQTVAGGKQFAGNVEDRKAEFKVGPSAKEGTPNTGGTSPNESKVEERGLKPYALAPFSSWGKVGYERRLYTLFTRAAYTNESADVSEMAMKHAGVVAARSLYTETKAAASKKAHDWVAAHLPHATCVHHPGKGTTEVRASDASAVAAHINGCVAHVRGLGANSELNKHGPWPVHAFAGKNVVHVDHGTHDNGLKESEAGKSESPKAEVDEAKRGRPRDLIGVREYQGKGNPRKRIRRADGKWQWASKNRV